MRIVVNLNLVIVVYRAERVTFFHNFADTFQDKNQRALQGLACALREALFFAAAMIIDLAV